MVSHFLHQRSGAAENAMSRWSTLLSHLDEGPSPADLPIELDFTFGSTCPGQPGASLHLGNRWEGLEAAYQAAAGDRPRRLCGRLGVVPCSRGRAAPLLGSTSPRLRLHRRAAKKALPLGYPRCAPGVVTLPRAHPTKSAPERLPRGRPCPLDGRGGRHFVLLASLPHRLLRRPARSALTQWSLAWARPPPTPY